MFKTFDNATALLRVTVVRADPNDNDLHLNGP